MEEEEEAESTAEQGDDNVLQRLLTQLDDFWYDFWMGDYWNEPIAVEVTPFTVVGACVALTAASYMMAQLSFAFFGAGIERPELPLFLSQAPR